MACTKADRSSRTMSTQTGEPGVLVLSTHRHPHTSGELPRNPSTRLSCPHDGCAAPEMTHVVDVTWELDPAEGDRRRVRMEVRCENGHGFLLFISNHAGVSTVWCSLLSDNQSPFAEGVRW